MDAEERSDLLAAAQMDVPDLPDRLGRALALGRAPSMHALGLRRLFDGASFGRSPHEPGLFAIHVATADRRTLCGESMRATSLSPSSRDEQLNCPVCWRRWQAIRSLMEEAHRGVR